MTFKDIKYSTVKHQSIDEEETSEQSEYLDAGLNITQVKEFSHLRELK